jgi:hypothetical protein
VNFGSEETYSPDFSLEQDLTKSLDSCMKWFMHGNPKGMFVRTRGMFSRFADYSYSLDKSHFLHYGLEQQASIASDYWLLLNYGFEGNKGLYEYLDYTLTNLFTLIHKYRSAMNGFPG